MYLLATDFVAHVRAGSPQAVAWLRAVYPSSVYLSVITLGEIGRAFTNRVDSQLTPDWADWLRKLRHDHHDRILPVCGRVAAQWGAFGSSGELPVPAQLVAATAMVHDMMIVSGKAADFVELGASVVNPWDMGAGG